jgi:hypothetical protein
MIGKFLPCIIALFFAGGCGFYSFSGSSLPGNLKTVEIPLFANQSLESDVADAITSALSTQVVSGNLLKVVSHDGNATISGTVTSYANVPYTFSAADTRQVSVQQYVVRITAAVEFTDNKKGSDIYKGTITGEGIYNLQSENEQTGKTRAITQLVQLILQNSVQGW